VGDESRQVGPGDTVWIPAGVRQKIRNLGPAPLEFLCACGPAYVPECDQPVRQLALIEVRAGRPTFSPRWRTRRSGEVSVPEFGPIAVHVRWPWRRSFQEFTEHPGRG
jgi:hypothetical protein